MKTLELTLMNNRKITFFVKSIVNVICSEYDTAVINDTSHGSGGWRVKETYKEVMAILTK